jgi:hypothetical protein
VPVIFQPDDLAGLVVCTPRYNFIVVASECFEFKTLHSSRCKVIFLSGRYHSAKQVLIVLTVQRWSERGAILPGPAL